jgi:hypothetical protein
MSIHAGHWRPVILRFMIGPGCPTMSRAKWTSRQIQIRLHVAALSDLQETSALEGRYTAANSAAIIVFVDLAADAVCNGCDRRARLPRFVVSEDARSDTDCQCGRVDLVTPKGVQEGVTPLPLSPARRCRLEGNLA